MKRNSLLFVLFVIAWCMSGCIFAPWKDCIYVNTTNSPESHYAALNALTGWGASFDSFKVDDVMYSVMMEATGFYPNRKGPYTIWIQLATIGNRKLAVQPISRIDGLRVRVERDGECVYLSNELGAKFKVYGNLHARFVLCGEIRIALPDILTPTDGKEIKVVVEVKSKLGEVKTLIFCLRPIVKRGYIQVLG